MWSGTQVLAKYCHELRILTCFCGLSILLQLRPRCGKQTPLVWSLQNCSITHAHAHMHTHVRSFVKKLLKIIIVILYKNYDSSTAKRSGSFEKIWLERVFFFLNSCHLFFPLPQTPFCRCAIFVPASSVWRRPSHNARVSSPPLAPSVHISAASMLLRRVKDIVITSGGCLSLMSAWSKRNKRSASVC